MQRLGYQLLMMNKTDESIQIHPGEKKQTIFSL